MTSLQVVQRKTSSEDRMVMTLLVVEMETIKLLLEQVKILLKGIRVTILLI